MFSSPLSTSPGRVAPAVRLALVRRPWIRWLAIALAAAGSGWLVFGQLSDVDAARRSWTDQRTVFVATRDHAPGDLLEVDERRLPVAAVPDSAVASAPVDAEARQRISAGEIVTSVDVLSDVGPAAAAEDGQVVVAVSDPLLSAAATNLSVGLRVAVHSEGIVLAERARIVAVDGEVVFVAVDEVDAASVSAAAQLRLASLAFLR